MLWTDRLKALGRKEIGSLPVDEAAAGTMVLEAAATAVELAAAGTTVLEAAASGPGTTKTN
jgi:hypothetical protein